MLDRVEKTPERTLSHICFFHIKHHTQIILDYIVDHKILSRKAAIT
jgi:hypothetical protein